MSTKEEVGLAVADCREESNGFKLHRALQLQLQVWEIQINTSTARLSDIWCV